MRRAGSVEVVDDKNGGAPANPTDLLLRYASSVWQRPAVLVRADTALRADSVFRAISGPLNPNGTPLSTAQLGQLHALLGPANSLPRLPAAGVTVSSRLYNAYRATAQFISADGRTLQFYATLAAGDPTGTRALQAVPALRRAVADILHLVPLVLLVIGILPALVLRILIAPWYLIAGVGLSYLAALGLAVIVFINLQGNSGLFFVLPFFLFLFLMALGSSPRPG